MIKSGVEVNTGHKAICVDCGKFKKIHNKDGQCMWCWEKSRPNYLVRYKNKNLKSRYGITLTQRNQMKQDQNNKCAICLRDEEELGKDLIVDHCYKTGKVRGLICQACNIGIGNLQDSIDVVERALIYLKSYF